MDCAVFNDRLDALLDGALSHADEADARAHRVTCSRCGELYLLMRRDGPEASGGLDGAAPSGLTESILARTSGPPCAHAHERLAESVDRALDRGDVTADSDIGLALVDAHVQHCPDCAALSRALVLLHQDLPAFAELTPDAALVPQVLARTIPRPVRRAGRLDLLRGDVGRLLARPRIAWEAGYAATLVVWLCFGASWSPLRATPAQALTLIQQRASDTQSAGVSAMAALNLRVSRFSERALDDARGPDDEGGWWSDLSDYPRRAAEAAPNLGEHWQRLSRDAGAILRRLIFSTTDAGALPGQRSTS
ncbi:MAG: hypothetical protein O3A25_12715 [Acidobacteria bacterium]|nr:hypothetical protein [Acidobacteriota bacterium]